MTTARSESDLKIELRTNGVADIALRFEGEALSYPELDRRAAIAAKALRGMGVSRGDAFAVIGENCPEILTAYYAAAKLGAVFISVNSGLKVDEIRYILGHAKCVLLLHDQATAELAIAAAAPERRRRIEDLATSVSAEIVEPTDPLGDFMIAYTSGTTGVPKAVVFDQSTEVAASRALIKLWGVGKTDRIVVALPLGFLYGLSTACAMGLEAGAEIILLRRFHPKAVLHALVANKATIFHGVPTMFAMLLDYCEQNSVSANLSFMRSLICAGAPLAPELKRRFTERFCKPIDDYYALTEIRPVFGRYAGDDALIPAGAIGKAAPGADIRIVDGSGQAVGDGVQGEVLVRAAGTMLRYHKDPELTAQSFRDGLFATGDVGFRDAEGFYHLTGRIKDIIIRGGANIAPAEVENILLRHPSIQAAAVVGRRDAKFGEVPVAFVSWTEGVVGDQEGVIAHCRHHLADFKVPVRLFTLPEMPLGATGKVDKAKLKSMLETLA